METEESLAQIQIGKKLKPLLLTCQNLCSYSSNEASSASISIDLLPPEIVIDIFSKLPLKSISRCKSVSKLWHSIISNSTSLHFSQRHSTPDLLIRFNIGGTRFSPCYYLQRDSLSALTLPLPPRKRTLPPLHPIKLLRNASFPLEARLVGCCNGFLCYLTSISDIKSSNVATEAPFIHVFNPLTEQRITLPPLPIPKHHRPHLRNWVCGFGFDDSTSRYKVVFAAHIFSYDYEPGMPKLAYNLLLVYTLGTGAGWTSKIGVVPFDLFVSSDIAPVFLNGSLHWMARLTQRIPSDLPFFLCIISFNLATQEFRYVPIPEPYVFRHFMRDHQRIGILKDCLSVLEYCVHPDSFFDIWIMEEYNVRESWVKLFSIQPEPKLCHVAPKLIEVLNTGELLLLCKGFDAVGYIAAYNPVKQKFKRVSLKWPGIRHENMLEVYPIVGTLISVKAAFGVDST